MALLVLSGDIENAHPIDGVGVERMARDCHSIRRISGHEGQAVWECNRTVNGIEIRLHVLTNSKSFAHESLSRHERNLREQARQARIQSEAGLYGGKVVQGV